MNRWVLGVSVALLATGCGRGPASPAAPSKTYQAVPAGASALMAWQPAVVSDVRVRSADLASCLGASGDPACVSARGMATRAVGAAATAPGAPLNFSATASGSTVTLTWTAASSGDPVTTYIIEAGSTAGAANLYNSPTNSTATTFSASGVGSGTYYVRVRAQNAAGSSAPSNESILVVGPSACTSAPNAPGGLSASASGANVTITWLAPSGGCAPTSYILQAGSAPGLSNLAAVNTGSAATTFAATGVGAGTYYLRVLAANGYGQSAASNETQLIVGGVTTVAADPVSTFAANDTFSTSGTFFGGYPAVARPRISHDLAVAFSPSATTRLNTVEVALSGSIARTVQVTVSADAGGVPGIALETFNLTSGITQAGSIILLTSAQRTTLTGGAVYWITVSIPDAGPNDSGSWNRSLLSTAGSTATRDNPFGWAAEANDTRRQAFRVKFVA